MMDVRQPLELPTGGSMTCCSPPLLEPSGMAVSRLPVSLLTAIEAAHLAAWGVLPRILEQLLAPTKAVRA